MLKGMYQEMFLKYFVHQTVPPGPISHLLKPFGIKTKFHGVLKLLPGVRDPRESQIRGRRGVYSVRDSEESRIAGIRDTRESRIHDVCDT